MPTTTATGARMLECQLVAGGEDGVAQREKLLARIMSGQADASIDFGALRGLLRWLGFRERIRGSHHNFSRAGIPDRINLQKEGRHAKPYQVEQVREILRTHSLA